MSGEPPTPLSWEGIYHHYTSAHNPMDSQKIEGRSNGTVNAQRPAQCLKHEN